MDFFKAVQFMMLFFITIGGGKIELDFFLRLCGSLTLFFFRTKKNKLRLMCSFKIIMLTGTSKGA